MVVDMGNAWQIADVHVVGVVVDQVVVVLQVVVVVVDTEVDDVVGVPVVGMLVAAVDIGVVVVFDLGMVVAMTDTVVFVVGLGQNADMVVVSEELDVDIELKHEMNIDLDTNRFCGFNYLVQHYIIVPVISLIDRSRFSTSNLQTEFLFEWYFVLNKKL